MKTIAIVLVALMALTAVQAELIPSGGSLEATLLTYQPVPVQPGDLVEAWIQVQNDGDKASGAGTVSVLESYPFIAESAAERERSFPSIPPGGTFLVKTRLRVDKDAAVGENILRVRIAETGRSTTIERDLSLTVQGRGGTLSVSDVTTTPARVPPGSQARIAITIENTGDTRLRNIQAVLGLDGLSIAPMASSNSKSIPSLEGGERETIAFDVVTFPDAEEKAYQVPLTVSYEDDQGSATVQNLTIGLVVGSEPELLVYLEEVGAAEDKEGGDIVIRFVNKGLAEIKFLEFSVSEDESFSLISQSRRVYVGNIDADDYESADLSVSFEGEEATIPLAIRYKDALNQPYEENVTLQVRAPEKGGNGGAGWGVWILVLVILAAGGFFLLRRRKKKHA